MTAASHPVDTRLRHPFYLHDDGINRPAGPDKHWRYGRLAAESDPVVPIVREVAGELTPAYLICRHADVREVLRRQDVFSRAEAGPADPVDVAGTMLGMDGPEHAQARGSIEDFFTPAAVARLSDRIEAEAEARLAVLTARGGRADLIADFALPFALHTIGDLPADIQVKLPISLVVGGRETAASSIGTFFHVLHTRPYGDHPTAWAHLVAHPEQVDRAITELERLHSTGNADAMPRRVRADVRLPSGVSLRKGDIVVPSPDAANRDPRVFPDPERMDFGRDPNPHLSFGYGPHYCVGAHWGALEVRVALRLLLRELPGLRLAVPPEQVRWKAGQLILGPEALPVRW
ncbi:cytochrome P450 [Micromonospora sp. WMMA1923]|uniref:cytochrome P450 n=1 Tax=Micromonospora sp. WMMA1923 TaxID=3404125 RepID=UPI003B95F274